MNFNPLFCAVLHLLSIRSSLIQIQMPFFLVSYKVSEVKVKRMANLSAEGFEGSNGMEAFTVSARLPVCH